MASRYVAGCRQNISHSTSSFGFCDIFMQNRCTSCKILVPLVTQTQSLSRRTDCGCLKLAVTLENNADVSEYIVHGSKNGLL